MKIHLSTVVLALSLFFMSCATNHYRTNKGLIFNYEDWGQFFEQPYVMMGADGATENSKVYQMYLPGQLFNNTEIKYVYFRQMKSDMVRWTEAAKPQVLVTFEETTHKVDEPLFGISKNQAVVYLKIGTNKEKVIKLEDMRIIDKS